MKQTKQIKKIGKNICLDCGGEICDFCKGCYECKTCYCDSKEY